MAADMSLTTVEYTNGVNGKHLHSLEIVGFRAFNHLTIEKLGGVNLIVGKNSVGKSCLLEALRLYVERGAPQILWQLLASRNEDSEPMRRYTNLDADAENSPFIQVQHLFHGRQSIEQIEHEIKIGPLFQPYNQLKVGVGVLDESRESDGPRQLRSFRLSNQLPLFDNDLIGTIPGLSIRYGNESELVFPLLRDQFARPRIDHRMSFGKARSVFVGAQGLSIAEVDKYWDQTKLRSTKTKVLNALQIIAPEIEDIDIFGVAERARDRIVKVKLRDIAEPVPLKSMGDGLNRIFGLIVALVNSIDGILLIDEIESGLHYSVQRDLWRLIFQTAHQLNVQVFATTHSWDCIETFQKAAVEDEQEEGLLIRLQRRGDEIVPISFSESELSIATREQIEIR